METQTYAIPEDYLSMCRTLYKQAFGCMVNGQVIMVLHFSERIMTACKHEGATVMFATDQWEAHADFKQNLLKVSAPNTDIIEKVVKHK